MYMKRIVSCFLILLMVLLYAAPTALGAPAKQKQSITGTVYNDLNANGVLDSGEPGIAKVTVQLYDASGTTLLGKAGTAKDGTYTLKNLKPGTYTVKGPSGYFTTSPSTVTVVVGAGSVVTVNFGIVSGQVLSKYDTVIQDMYGSTAHVIDTNYNGLLDRGDKIAYTQNGQTIVQDFTGNEIYDLQFRTCMVLNSYAMVTKEQSGMITMADGSNPTGNADFWEPIALNNAIYLKVKAGVNPSDAINDVFNPNGGTYSIDCSFADNLINFKSRLDTIGAEDFNREYAGLTINGWDTYYQPVGGTMVHDSNGGQDIVTGDPTVPGSASMLRIGDNALYYNPSGGDMQNAVYLGMDSSGNPQFFGHPYGIFTGEITPFGYLTQYRGYSDPDLLAALDVTPETTWDP